MKWQKPTQALFDTFEIILPKHEYVERRKMFGYPCAFVNNNMFIGGHQVNDIVLRLNESDKAEFLTLEGARQFEPQPGRIMREYVVIPDSMFEPKQKKILTSWIEKSYQYVLSLPLKIKKAAKKKSD